MDAVAGWLEMVGTTLDLGVDFFGLFMFDPPLMVYFSCQPRDTSDEEALVSTVNNDNTLCGGGFEEMIFRGNGGVLVEGPVLGGTSSTEPITLQNNGSFRCGNHTCLYIAADGGIQVGECCCSQLVSSTNQMLKDVFGDAVRMETDNGRMRVNIHSYSTATVILERVSINEIRMVVIEPVRETRV